MKNINFSFLDLHLNLQVPKHSASSIQKLSLHLNHHIDIKTLNLPNLNCLRIKITNDRIFEIEFDFDNYPNIQILEANFLMKAKNFERL